MSDASVSQRTPQSPRRHARELAAALVASGAAVLALAPSADHSPRAAQPPARAAGAAAPVQAAVPTAGGASAATRSGIPTDPLWAQAWSLRALHLPDVWRQVAGRPASVVVAVVDTGVDGRQPDLRGALVQWYDATGAGALGDVNGHGTLAAGIIAARSNNGIGGTGACPWCSVMPVRVLGADGGGATPAIAAGIRWAADQGARVINMSFVLDGRQREITDAAVYAHARGAVLVAAAGNTGASTPTYPAADPFVIGVAATQQDASLYDWSDRGPWVEISAPGCTPSTAPGAKYETFCGTSAASAVVSGVVALALSLVPGATNVDVEQALRRSAVPRPDGSVALGSLDARALVAELRTAVRAR